MKTRIAMGLAAGMCVAGLAMSALAVTANLTEKFDAGQAAWGKAGSGQIIYSGVDLALAFSQTGGPTTQKGELRADSAASGGRFAGDFKAAGITAIAFDVKLSGAMSVCLSISSGSGYTWRRTLDPAPAVGEWTTYVVPLDSVAGWGCDSGNPTQASFDADLSQVTSVGLFCIRGELSQESCVVDNVKLIGAWGNFTADGLPEAWLQEYLNLSGSGHANEDADGDGLSNLGEFLAGTDPTKASSTFTVKIQKNEAGQTVIRWKHEAGRSFSVLRTANLNEPFEKLPGMTGITSAGPENERVVEEPNGPYFYKVEIEQQ
jgi:hypothetical protein